MKNKNLKISTVAEDVPNFHVLQIDQIANQLINQGKDIIKLNLGKSDVAMPKYVADKISNEIYDTVKREIIDSQGLLALREEIAKDYKINSGVKISPKQIFINNGTSPFFLSLSLLLANPGDEIMLPLPYYPSYSASATMAKLNKKFYRIINNRIRIDDIKNNFVPGKTKIIVVNSPGNPFGNVLTKEELKGILRAINGRAYIISDEIYDGFVYRNKNISILSVCDPKRDKVIVLNGFSKIHRMYTRRLGYAIVPRHLQPYLLKFQQHTLVCVDPVTQMGGLVSLKNKERLIQDEIKKEVAEYQARLNACRKLLRGTKIKIIEPEGSFYMCVDLSYYTRKANVNSLALATDLLQKFKVAVTPGEDFGKEDFFRISLTNSRAVDGVARMVKFFNKLK